MRWFPPHPAGTTARPALHLATPSYLSDLESLIVSLNRDVQPSAKRGEAALARYELQLCADQPFERLGAATP
jgi:hypothetical protein